MNTLQKQVRDLRLEGRLAQYLAVGFFALIPIGQALALFQGGSTSPSGRPEIMFLMLLGFLATAYSRLTFQMAQLAKAIAEPEDQAALAQTRSPLENVAGPKDV